MRPPSGTMALFAVHQDGTADFDLQGDVVIDPVQSHAHGSWKEHGARTFITTFLVLEYNKDCRIARNCPFPPVFIQSLSVTPTSRLP
jgi:hypothetical protein